MADQLKSKEVTLPVIFDAIEEILSSRKFDKIGPLLHVIDSALKTHIKTSVTIDVSDCIVQLMHQYNADENALAVLLQVIYQILKTLSEQKDFPIIQILDNDAWWKSLLEQLFTNNWPNSLISNALICLQIFNRVSNNDCVIEFLWCATMDKVKNKNVPRVIQFVIIQFFDKFASKLNDLCSYTEFVDMLQTLATSDIRDERKTAYQVMKKLADLPVLVEVGKLSIQNQYWTSFVAVLENLEENQSHLILPSLNSLKQVEFQKPSWRRWLEIVYTKILSHQNILVTRWALEDCLKSLTCANISEKMLEHFLTAANNTSLYNYEGYFLPTENICKFLNCDIEIFLLTMAKINWKSVPLHFWFSQVFVAYELGKQFSYKLTFQLAAKVRILQNPFVRQKTIEKFEKIFSATIEEMELKEYINLIETLYNIMDPFCSLNTLKKKLIKSLSCDESVPTSQRFYKIITNNLQDELSHDNDDNLKTTINQIKCNDPTFFEEILEHIKLNHNCNWLNLMIVFECENPAIVNKFCQLQYKIGIDYSKSNSFEILREKWVTSLSVNANERTFVSEKFVDFFIQVYVKVFPDIFEYMVKPEELFSMGSHKTLLRLSTLIAEHNNIEDVIIMDAFIESLQKYHRNQQLCYKVASNLIKYCKNVYSIQETEKYIERLLLIDLLNMGICEACLSSGITLKKDIYMQGLLLGDPKTGDARIEEIYEFEMRKICPRHVINHKYIISLNNLNSEEILNDLIKLNNTISNKKPRYFENSMEHRIKMRIAFAVLLNVKTNYSWFEPALESLLKHNNQLNINYIYEFVAAKCAPNTKVVLEKLQDISNLTVCQQVSLMSIGYSYCVLNWSQITDDTIEKVINKLLPLTMGANFQTRLYAQLFIYSILEKCISESGKRVISGSATLKRVICETLGKQMDHFLHDTRLLLPNIFLEMPTQLYNILMYITNAPVDEYSLNFDCSKYKSSRWLFAKKISNVSKQTTTNNIVVDNAVFEVSNIQRKMNPIRNICVENDFLQTQSTIKSEMIVVASLVEKVPNLGGIARTCDVLGIQNLVLSSRLHVEKNEFKSLSMTAEKSLNIIEIRPPSLIDYFREKQLEGYKIVGAEQTVDSKNIIDFKFPQKCILVLGHEKEGIPSNILGFLDYTIEVPQFGMVRSLNVHVTGALFMWEYCKQHIVG